MVVNTEFYDRLGIKPDATFTAIKIAYKRMALKWHPDKNRDDPKCEEKFKKIHEAYSVLRDVEKRRNYDTFGKGEENIIFSSPFQNSTFDNIFNMFTNFKFNKKLDNVIYKRGVTLEEICTRKIISIKVTRDRLCKCQKNRGIEKCVHCRGNGKILIRKALGIGIIHQIPVTCDVCQGRGYKIISCGECRNGVVNESKIFNIHLTPNTENGHQYKFSGDGNEFPGIQSGDFIVEIIYKKHPIYGVQSGNLTCTKKITLLESLCGYNHVLLHPSGKEIKVISNKIIKPYEKTIIKGEGLSEDLIIEHIIEYPNELTKKQKKILRIVFKTGNEANKCSKSEKE